MPRRLGHELLEAAERADKEAVRELLAAGADPDGGDWGVLSTYGSFTIPLIALGENCGDDSDQEELAEITRMLVEAGADVDLARFDYTGPLHAAAYSGATGIIRVLLEAGADAAACSEMDGTPLEIANYFRNHKAARMLRKWMRDHGIPTE